MAAWVGAALTGLGALGGLFGSRKSVTDQSYSNTTTPTYDPKNQAFRDYLIDMYRQRVSGAGEQDFQNSYTNTGLNNLARTSKASNDAIENLLTSRGLGQTTAGVGTLRDTALSNASQLASFLNNIPLIMDQRRAANLAQASGYQSSLPVGQTSSGTSHTVGTGPASPISGMVTGGAQGLAGYLGQLSAASIWKDIMKNSSTRGIPVYGQGGEGDWANG